MLSDVPILCYCGRPADFAVGTSMGGRPVAVGRCKDHKDVNPWSLFAGDARRVAGYVGLSYREADLNARALQHLIVRE